MALFFLKMLSWSTPWCTSWCYYESDNIQNNNIIFPNKIFTIYRKWNVGHIFDFFYVNLKLILIWAIYVITNQFSHLTEANVKT